MEHKKLEKGVVASCTKQEKKYSQIPYHRNRKHMLNSNGRYRAVAKLCRRPQSMLITHRTGTPKLPMEWTCWRIMLKRDRNRNFSATFTSSTFKSVCSAAGAFLFPVSMTPNIARDVGFFDLPQAGKGKKKKKNIPGPSPLSWNQGRGKACNV